VFVFVCSKELPCSWSVNALLKLKGSGIRMGLNFVQHELERLKKVTELIALVPFVG